MIKNIFYTSLIFIISSCSFFNEKKIALPIKSNPSGASIYIDGQYFGQTPTQVKLEPNKNYRATIAKKDYGSVNIDLETWYSIRGNQGGSDMTRCILDAAGVMLVIPAVGFYSVYCRDFKQKEYVVNLISDSNYQGAGLKSGNGPTPANSNNAPDNKDYNPYSASNPYMGMPNQNR